MATGSQASFASAVRRLILDVVFLLMGLSLVGFCGCFALSSATPILMALYQIKHANDTTYPTPSNKDTFSPKKAAQKRTKAAVRDTEIPLSSNAEDAFRIMKDSMFSTNPSADAPKKCAGLLWMIQNAPVANIVFNSHVTTSIIMQNAPAGAM